MAEPDLHFQVSAERGGERLDRLVAQAAAVSRRIARTWIATGRVLVGGRPVRILTRPIRAGAEITVRRTTTDTARGDTGARGAAASPAAAVATGREARRARSGPGGATHAPLRVLFLDRWLLVIDKPAGLLTEHDRFGSPSVESLAPALLASRGERPERRRIWLVHRLDAGTSGVLAIARTPMAAKVLGEAFRQGQAHKTYLALCRGRFEGERLVDAPIARAERTRHAVSPGGKPARTRLLGLGASDAASLVRAEPASGRTHQIRVHLTHLGHPLLGDGLYGGPGYAPGDPPEPIGRPMLHALRLRLAHPKTGAPLILTATPPADFADLAGRYGLVLPGDER